MTADAYVVLLGDSAAALEALSRTIARRLAGSGWSRRFAHPFIAVYAPATSKVDAVAALDGHGVLIGEMFDRAGHPLAPAERGVLACRTLDSNRATDIVSSHWGRYVLVRRTSAGVAILRDPSGAVEAVTWRKNGVCVIAPDGPPALDCLMPDDLAIDWGSVKGLMGRSGGYRHELALSGFTPVASGELLNISPARVRSQQIWSPSDIYRTALERGRPDLREVVDRAVQALAGQRHWVLEVSGGLDSAIVAGALTSHQRARVTQWVNHFVDDPEGDEREFARPVVERDGYAARAAYADAIPPSIFDRRSKGELGAFYGEAVARNLDFLRTYLLEGELAGAGLLPQGLADDMTREALVWRGGFSRLLTLALTEGWLRRWQTRIAASRV
ncbi:asparagine synthase-related protein [uncultured Brevundimonas sp.]|uniref:asparagine synthase-related protein n=1 Tax=uncultured Brevundimonas sp. TaxID=213418 RepID=UPI0025D15B3B|nr:asparagine synthase-related protein [uncultured Brevundimonas sp.]